MSVCYSLQQQGYTHCRRHRQMQILSFGLSKKIKNFLKESRNKMEIRKERVKRKGKNKEKE